jgi:hypothetical protein
MRGNGPLASMYQHAAPEAPVGATCLYFFVFGPASLLAVDLRTLRLRLSSPANQRFVSDAPNMRRSLSRRSAFLRYLHVQFLGIVQVANGRRGAWRSR